ncbi:hypothetical protein ACFY9F_07665 [Streptomyces sp. NPDC012421]|uniref:hypothetical protein n=1 Tax=Streptomyces sp. NPDC012421 TaxID=3364832 RepID=UPI0036EED326
MGAHPRRPHGAVRLASLGVALVTGATLLTGWSPGGATGRAAPSPSPSASADELPTLKKGKTLKVRTAPVEILDVPASTAEVTLTDLKQADRLPQGEFIDPEVAEPGTTFVCLEFKVENVSDEDFDTAFLSRARWTGKDGETTKVDQEIGGNCAGVGLAEENLLTEPDPRPGEFVRGTTVLEVPDDQPGVLEFADASEHPLFKVETTASR